MLTSFNDDEKRSDKYITMGRITEIAMINDSGFYRLIFHKEKTDPSSRAEGMKLKEWTNAEIMKMLQTCPIPYTETRANPPKDMSMPNHLKDINMFSKKSVIINRLSGIKIGYIIHLCSNIFVFGSSTNLKHVLAEYSVSFWPSASIVNMHPIEENSTFETAIRSYLKEKNLLRNDLCFIEELDSANTFVINSSAEWYCMHLKFMLIATTDACNQSLRLKKLEEEKKMLEKQLSNRDVKIAGLEAVCKSTHTEKRRRYGFS